MAGDLTAQGTAAKRWGARLVWLVAFSVSGGVSGWLIGRAGSAVAGDRNAPWIVGRAAGVTAYLLMVVLVLMGLVLSHPWRVRIRRPTSATRIRLHVSLAIFTLVFTTLHIVVLVNDEYAGVGWRGLLLPMGASYRPVPVTLGLIGLYSGILAGLTAALSGHLPYRVWWPVHKVSALALVLVWLHGVLAGSDSVALRVVYAVTGVAVLGLALSRYMSHTPADRVAQLTRTAQASPDHLASSAQVRGIVNDSIVITPSRTGRGGWIGDQVN